ncbi:hypothetical protein EYR38_001947 [Pleurotus pulmonarius]|nr:hypothetical protein EYR38_001947 [Pleurotus pulmonarius]
MLLVSEKEFGGIKEDKIDLRFTLGVRMRRLTRASSKKPANVDNAENYRSKTKDRRIRKGETWYGMRSGVFIQTLNLTIPEHAVDAGAERWSGETLDVLLPHLPNLRKLSAFYIGEDEWPVSKLALLPNPAKLTLLAVGIVHNYPVFLKFLRTCPLLECLFVGMVADKKGRLPKVIPPHVIPGLRRVHCGPDFLYFAVLEGRRVKHIDLLASDITTAILHGADMNALATPMALVRSLAVNDEISLSDVLRGDVIAPYSQLEFLAIAISDIIDIDDAQVMAELWSKQLRYVYIQCEGCEPDHDDVAEAFFTFMPSLVMLDIEICPECVLNTSPRCSRYIRGIPMGKDTEIEFGFPSYQDFQEPFWVDEVNDLSPSESSIG